MSDIKWTAASAVVLYLCMFRTFILCNGVTDHEAAPFLVDYVYKLI